MWTTKSELAQEVATKRYGLKFGASCSQRLQVIGVPSEEAKHYLSSRCTLGVKAPLMQSSSESSGATTMPDHMDVRC